MAVDLAAVKGWNWNQRKGFAQDSPRDTGILAETGMTGTDRWMVPEVGLFEAGGRFELKNIRRW